MGKILDILVMRLMILFIASLPLVESRGAIPIGISLGIDPIQATVLGILGSLIPVPFLLLFMDEIFKFLGKIRFLDKILDKITNRTLKKSDIINKYSVLGLALFVAIPMPNTGIWTACLAASLFKIPSSHALLGISIGASIAGLIILILSYGIILW